MPTAQTDAATVLAQRQLIDQHGEVASTLIDSFQQKGTAAGEARMATSQRLTYEAQAYGSNPKKGQLQFEELQFHRAHQAEPVAAKSERV